MAEAAERTRRNLLRLLGKLFGSLLGMLGVITAGCDHLAAAYGMEPCSDNDLIVHGRVMSALDSSGVNELLVGVSLPEPLDFQCVSQTNEEGEYLTGYDFYELEPEEIPDLMLLRVHDPRGEWPDTYPDLDTLIWAPCMGTATTVNIDLYLEPYGED